MENYIKVGIGVMILNENKILLGHRTKNKKDIINIDARKSVCYNIIIYGGTLK